MAWRPANYLLGTKLLVGYDDAEDDKQNDGVFIVESVSDNRVIAVMAEDRIWQPSYGRKQVHPQN